MGIIDEQYVPMALHPMADTQDTRIMIARCDAFNAGTILLSNMRERELH